MDNRRRRHAGGAAEKYKGNDWDAIAELVPGRTTVQCKDRWYEGLSSKSDETTARKGKRWITEEDDTLRDAAISSTEPYPP
jgi:hypothetical protein